MGAAEGVMSLDNIPSTAHRLREALAGSNSPVDSVACLRELIRRGLDQLPLPGSGRTLERWRALAAVAEHDLSLAKLYEGHTDALVILHELGSGSGFHDAGQENPPRVPLGQDLVWGVWASEAPGGRVMVQPDPQASDGRVRLQGVKQWCSGAKTGSHALLTAWHPDEKEPQLAWLALAQPGVRVSDDEWKAVGMNASASLRVQFNDAAAYLVGQPGQYLSRPGFWQGGAGVAACWYGGTLTLAKTLYAAVAQSPEGSRSPFRLAAAGRVAVMMRGLVLLLQDAARWIDEHPRSDASVVALRVRLAAAQCATEVLEEVAAALGATPFCTDAAFARAAADLPVFIRQSHSDRDYAALGQQLVLQGNGLWAL
jgi:alkylation response protein AidB-like acyl-CoA dehydrogenase